MKRYLWILIAICSLPLWACVPLMLGEPMSEFAEKMTKLQMEREEKMRAIVSTIEGEIAKTEVKEVEEEVVEIFHASINEKENKEPPPKKIVKRKVFVVYFSDGREKTFKDVSDKPLTSGKYYIIKYNGLDEIVETEEK